MLDPHAIDSAVLQTSNNTSSERVVTPKFVDSDDQKEAHSVTPAKAVAPVKSSCSNYEFYTNLNASELPGSATAPQTPAEEPAVKEAPKRRKVKMPKRYEGISPPRNMTRPNTCSKDEKDFPVNKVAESMEAPPSFVYVTSQAGTNFRLNFVATNVSFEPLFICPRKRRPKPNEKDIQVIAHETVVEEYDTASDRLFITRPKFIVEPYQDEPHKVVLPPLRVYTSNQLRRNPESISRPQRSATVGFIYVRFDGILMKIRVKPLPITKVKLPVTDDVKATMERLRMPSSDSAKNRAQLLVRYNNDVLKISFGLSECSLSRLPERKSLAIQTEAKVVLRSEYCPVAQKMVYIPIPESTYYYKDPMIDIRRLNDHFARMKIHPLWKHEMFHKRVSAMRGSGTIEQMVEKVLKRSRGSILVFEGFNAVATAIGGLLCARVSDGAQLYESKMHTYLGNIEQEPSPKEVNVSSSAELQIKVRVSVQLLT
ncbi:hypothetical protein SprV_0200836200 [Sparganum proliferum]